MRAGLGRMLWLVAAVVVATAVGRCDGWGEESTSNLKAEEQTKSYSDWLSEQTKEKAENAASWMKKAASEASDMAYEKSGDLKDFVSEKTEETIRLAEAVDPRKAYDEAKQKAEMGKEKAEEALEYGKDKAAKAYEEAKGEAEKAYVSAKESMTEEAKDRYEGLKERVSRAAGDVGDKMRKEKEYAEL